MHVTGKQFVMKHEAKAAEPGWSSEAQGDKESEFMPGVRSCHT